MPQPLRFDRLIRSLVRTAGRLSRTSPWRSSRAPRSTGDDSYPGDFHGMPRVSYSPVPGHQPDPGEIVWTWVPYEEDHTQGKDRPVLLIGRDKTWLLGLPLTSKDHDRDASQEASEGRSWVDIGSGAWDKERRPSEVRLDRIIRIDPARVRRTTVALPRDRFVTVVAAMEALLR